MGAILAYAPVNDKFCEQGRALQAFIYDLNTFELVSTLSSEKFGDGRMNTWQWSDQPLCSAQSPQP